MKIDLVVSVFDFNTDWTKFLNNNVNVFLYRKGNEKIKDNEIFLEKNVGRDVHVFFNHIYTNYDKLADITFFCQDFPFDHWENIIETINDGFPSFEKNAQMTIGGYYAYHFNTQVNPEFIRKYNVDGSNGRWPGRGMFNLHKSEHHSGGCISCNSRGLPHEVNMDFQLDLWWTKFFKSPIPNRYEFIPGGHFGITNNHVKLRSKKFYAKIVNFLEEEYQAPWIVERFEPYFFNMKYEELDELK